MARTDRLFRLMQVMREMTGPITASRLAEATSVSLRSLYRDIDSLRAAGARIEGERGYGYRLVEDNALPPQTFDRYEIEALALGLAEVKNMGDPRLADAATSVLAKVAATLPDHRDLLLVNAISQVYRPVSRSLVTPDLDAIRRACWQENEIHIGYEDQLGIHSERNILPLALVYTDRTLTLLAWCRLRDAFRMFRADRITNVSMIGSSFRPKRVPLLREFLNQLNYGRTVQSSEYRRPGG